MKHSRANLFLLAGIICFTAQAQGQFPLRPQIGAQQSQDRPSPHVQEWVLQFTSESIFLPLDRSDHSAVYDENSNRMIVFGGFRTGPSIAKNDVLVMTNANGSQGAFAGTFSTLIPDGAPGSPSPRNGHTAVYDPKTNRMIVFGGCTGIHCTGAEISNELWALTNANGLTGAPSWTQLTPAGGPPPARAGHTAVYDQVHNRMIVFGGFSAVVPVFAFLGDVWVLSNANGVGGTPAWTQLLPSGILPPATALHSAVYDSERNVMTIFGGEVTETQPTNAVWTLANANGEGGAPVWSNIVPDGTEDAPSRRIGHSAVYDPGTNRMIVFGGTADVVFTFPALNDVWVLANANGHGGAASWKSLRPRGIQPVGRLQHSAIYDPKENAMTIFGGDSDEGTFFSAWVLTKANGIF